MPIYRIAYTRRSQQDTHKRRIQLFQLIGLFTITLTVTGLGLVFLDPTHDPWLVKSFNALWNATNLVTTLGDFTPFTNAQKIFMIGASFTIMVLGGYAVSQTINWLTNNLAAINRENRLMSRTLDELNQHIIVIGYSTLGRLVAQMLNKYNQAVVIIEKRDDLASQAAEQGHLVILGDAGVDDDVLTRARIGEAQALVVASESPDRKLAITLMAHARNPQLRIAVTAEDSGRSLLLRRAGATDVIMAEDMIALTMVNHLITPPLPTPDPAATR